VEVVKRVCLLTGASGPLGTAFVERYADRYDIVAVHHRRPVYFPTQEQEFVDPLSPERDVAANACRTYAIRADISRQEDIDAVVQEALDAFGRVDLLVNAAAVRRFSPLLVDGGDAGAADLFSVNLLAPLRLSLSLARTFWRADADANIRFNRNILNVSSTAGVFVYPDTGQALYASSKAALNHLTYHLASELWSLGVRVNAVAPDTFPGRVSIEDVLEAMVAFDESAETGQVLPLFHPD
jgi:NAD(P)-dependent dehydrogenase (short-subunit alcohol dehydrogenase family)